MKVLIVYAHPEPRSLNGALKDFAVQRLQSAGHEVQVSDLYAMRWKAALDADDDRAPTRPARVSTPRPTPNGPSTPEPRAPTSKPSRPGCAGPTR